jgi:hypothetical protein
LSGVAAAFGPAAVEVIVVWREAAGPLQFAPERDSTGSQPAADRFALNSDQGRNTLERRAGRFQPCCFPIHDRLARHMANARDPL